MTSHTNAMMQALVRLLGYFSVDEVSALATVFQPLLPAFGRHVAIWREPIQNVPESIFTSALLLYLAMRAPSPTYEVVRLLLWAGNAALDPALPPVLYWVRHGPLFGTADASPGHSDFALEKSCFAPALGLTSQALALAHLKPHMYAYNFIVVPALGVRRSALIDDDFFSHAAACLRAVGTAIFTENSAMTLRLFKNVVAQPTRNSVFLLSIPLEIEQKAWQMRDRCDAFFRVALYRHPPTREGLAAFKETPFADVAGQFVDLWEELQNDLAENERIKTHILDDRIADLWLELADFMRISPDTRVQILLELAKFQDKNSYTSESTTAYLLAATLVAEHLARKGGLPQDAFRETRDDEGHVHPAKSFVDACPCAASEACRERILAETPNIRGFCTSKYFTLCSLLFLIQTAMEECKRGKLFELQVKMHSLLRPLAENLELWRVLEKTFQNGATAWSWIAEMDANKDRVLGTYYKVQFQGIGTYIYRETSVVNMWQVVEKLRTRGVVYAGGKEVWRRTRTVSRRTRGSTRRSSTST